MRNRLALVALLLVLLSSCATPPVPLSYRIYIPAVSDTHARKRGVVDLSTCADVAMTGATWTYVYYPVAPACPGVEGIPMVTDAAQMAIPASKSAWLLGFNEPDNAGTGGHYQTITQAAQNWRIIEQQYPYRKLVAPAPAGGASINPTGWINRWRDEYHTLYGVYPRIDAMAVHVYLDTVSYGIWQTEQTIALADLWGVGEIWVTEWGVPYGACGTSQVQIAATFKAWMDANARVTRYSWFGTAITMPQPWYPTTWCDLSLVSADGTLTQFGEVLK